MTDRTTDRGTSSAERTPGPLGRAVVFRKARACHRRNLWYRSWYRTGVSRSWRRGDCRGGSRGEIDKVREAMAPADCRVLDVRDGRAVEALVGELGALDVVVNCAGIIRRVDEFESSVFEEVIDINLTGTMRVCIAARPLLARSRGSHRQLGVDAFLLWRRARARLFREQRRDVQLTKSLAIAFAADGIRVNAIAPGWIQTPLTAALHQDEDRSRAILERTPLKRWGTPQDLVGGVLFLCSPAAAFITGSILAIDGGYSVV